MQQAAAFPAVKIFLTKKILSKRNYCYVRITKVFEQHPGEATGHGAAFKAIPT